MEQYIFKRRTDGVHIINLRKTWEKLVLAARAIAAIENPAEVFVTASRSYAQRAVLKFDSANESAVDETVGAEAAEQHQSQNVSAERSWGSGRCNAQDEALMHKMGPGHADGSWSQVVAWCARRAYRWFKFHTDEMTKCIAKKSGVRDSCAYCFGVVGGQYGHDNCKAPCLFGKWCSHGCLTCTHKAEDTQRCAGMAVDIPQPTFC